MKMIIYFTANPPCHNCNLDWCDLAISVCLSVSLNLSIYSSTWLNQSYQLNLILAFNDGDEPPGSSLGQHQGMLFGLKVTQTSFSSSMASNPKWLRLFLTKLAARYRVTRKKPFPIWIYFYISETLKSWQLSTQETFLMLSPFTTTVISL